MRVLVGDETGLVKSIELEKSEQCIVSSRNEPQARSRGIQRLCWYARANEEVHEPRDVVVARANGIVESYEASHGTAKEPDWSWKIEDPETKKRRCVGLDGIPKWGSVVHCWDTGDVVVRKTLQSTENAAHFNVGGDLNIMRLEVSLQTVIGVGGKEHDLQLWSLETHQQVFKAKNVAHDKLDMRVPVWVKDLRFLSTPGTSNGYRVIVGTGHRHVRIYDSNTKRRPVQELNNCGENPIQSMCVSPDETKVFVGDTAGNLDIFDLRTLKHMGRCTGPVGSIRDIACHPTLPYIAAVGLDRMVHVFDVNTRNYRHKIYAKQRLNSVLFCADGLKSRPEAEEPDRKRQKLSEAEMDVFEDEDEEEAYEGLEISEEEGDDDEDEDEEEEEGGEEDSRNPEDECD